MIILLFFLLLATVVQSCKDVSADCKPIDDSKFTVDQVITNIHEIREESSEFFAKYMMNINKFKVEMESGLLAERILLEELLKEHHDNQLQKSHATCDEVFNKTSISPSLNTTVTTPATKVTKPEWKIPPPSSEECKSLMKSGKRCENCTTPTYDEANRIFTCTKGFAFEITKEARQLLCTSHGYGAELIYESTLGFYNGSLKCFPLPPEKRHNCSTSCAQTATCTDNKAQLECVCMKGFNDVSAKFKKPPGSICTKCNNSDPIGTDFVMLYDESISIKEPQNNKMIEFVKDFLDFIDLDNTDNRFSLIEFSTLAELRFPLTPKIRSAKIIETLQSNASRYQRGLTNTPDALKIAKDEVYAKLPATNRSRVTLLFTDGQPSAYYTAFENITDFRKMDPESARVHLLNTAGTTPIWDGKVFGEEWLEIERNFATLATPDIQREAQIITIYIGRITEEVYVKMMREITSEDQEISVDNFEDLKNDVLDRLQNKIC